MEEQSEQNNQPASNSQLQYTTGLKVQLTAAPSSLYSPTNPPKQLNKEASCCPDLRSKPDSLSVSGSGSYSKSLDSSQSPSGAAAAALRDSYEDEAFDPIVPIVAAHVEAQQFVEPDAQVGDTATERAHPSAGLELQLDMVMQHQIEERDQCISVDLNGYEQGEEPFIVPKSSQAQS